MGTASKSFVLFLIALFLTSLVMIQPATVKAQSKTIIVPDDYPTISSAALDNATVGDTILVKSGTSNITFRNRQVTYILISEFPYQAKQNFNHLCTSRTLLSFMHYFTTDFDKH